VLENNSQKINHLEAIIAIITHWQWRDHRWLCFIWSY